MIITLNNSTAHFLVCGTSGHKADSVCKSYFPLEAEVFLLPTYKDLTHTCFSRIQFLKPTSIHYILSLLFTSLILNLCLPIGLRYALSLTYFSTIRSCRNRIPMFDPSRFDTVIFTIVNKICVCVCVRTCMCVYIMSTLKFPSVLRIT